MTDKSKDIIKGYCLWCIMRQNDVVHTAIQQHRNKHKRAWLIVFIIVTFGIMGTSATLYGYGYIAHWWELLIVCVAAASIASLAIVGCSQLLAKQQEQQAYIEEAMSLQTALASAQHLIDSILQEEQEHENNTLEQQNDNRD